MRPAPRWGPLPWFVLVLTGLVVLLVVVLPPFVLDESAPPGWVERRADRVASWHGDPDPVEAVWLEVTWKEAAELLEGAEAADVEPTTPSPDGSATPSPLASGQWSSASPKPSKAELRKKAVTDPDRAMYVVAMRGRFDSGPHGVLSPATAPERWLLVVFDSVQRDRWQVGVFDRRPDLPEDETKIFPL